MNKRVKSTAILMALILAFSVFTSLAATTAVAAAATTPTAEAATTSVAATTATPTATPTAAATATPSVVAATATTATITASNTFPDINQPVTFTVSLKAGSTLLSKPVKIWHSTNGVRWEDGTHNTVNGVYSFTQAFATTGQRVYHAEFQGDSTYGASVGTVLVDVGLQLIATTNVITASKTNPAINEPVTFTVTLKSSLSGLSYPVKVWHTTDGVRYEDGIHNTVNGVYTFSQSFGSTGQRVYHVEFEGNSNYGASFGSVTVYVGTTTLTITASQTNPPVGQTVTFTVSLKAGTNGLSKPVKVWHSWPGGSHADDPMINTVNGVKTFSVTFGSTGQRIYHAEFAGDGQYAASSNTVVVNVGRPTTLTITASKTNPAANEWITMTVTLKAGSAGLSKSVKVWEIYNGERHDMTVHTVNGVVSWTTAFDYKKPVVFHAEFAGDSQYAASSGTVTVNVI